MPRSPRKKRKTYLNKGSPLTIPRSTRLRRNREYQDRMQQMRDGHPSEAVPSVSQGNVAVASVARESVSPSPGTARETQYLNAQSTTPQTQGSNSVQGAAQQDLAAENDGYGTDDAQEDFFMSSSEDDDDALFGATVPPSPEDIELLSGQLDELRLINLPSSSTTVADAVTMIMTFMVAHGLPWTALDDLLHIVNALYGPSRAVLPRSKYLFRKLWAAKVAKLSKHFFYCELCGAELIFPPGTLVSQCTTPECNKQHHLARVKADGCFFTILDFRSQMTHLVKLMGDTLHANLVKLRDEVHPETAVTDITSAAHQQKLRSDGDICWQDLTITFNTDGSPVFKSSRSSIWPLQFTLNELPASVRFKNPVVTGLWFGPHHPNMPLFLSKFVDELNEATVTWSHNDEIINSNIYATCCCVDSPARAAVQNCVLFNGYFGCPWCLAPGDHDSGTMRYPYSDMIEERTSEMVVEDMYLALESDCVVNGIKGPSPVMNLTNFDLVWSFSVEYMHAVLLGVTRQITECWLDSTNSEERYYIGCPSVLSVLDRRLLSIKPPDCITRLPRSLKDRSFWKANEWRMWLLFYSLPCLRGVLPHIYWAHFRNLVEAIFILVASHITEALLHHAERLLQKFVSRLAGLYGDEMMTFNVHVLLHLPKAAKQQGPLWAHSAFVFESGNGKLTKLITAAKGVPSQVLERVIMSQDVEQLIQSDVLSDHVQNICRGMMGSNKLKNAIEVDGVWLLGCPKPPAALSPEELEGVAAVCGTVDCSPLEYVRFTFGKMMYHSEGYTKPTKSNATVIVTNTEEYLIIRKVLYVPDGTRSKCCIIGSRVFRGESEVRLPPHIVECFVSPTGTTAVIAASAIKNPVLFIDFSHDGICYVCTLPNTVESD